MALNRMTRIAGTLLIGAALVAGCAPAATPQPGDATPPPGGETYTIGVTFPILDQFLQTVADGMESKAAELGNVELIIVAAEERTDRQLAQVENFIIQAVDAIVVIPVDTDATGPMTAAAETAGIPLVYVNRRPADLPAGVPYVGSDSLYAGTIMMEELARLAGGQGNVVILIGDPANEAARYRTQGCKDVVAQNPGMTIIREQAGNWYREEGLAIMENWIQAGEQIDIVCSNNDEMALGAIQALKNANLLDEVLVGGVDATADALAAMAAGELEVTVLQNADAQGGGGIDAAVKLIRGETVPDYVDVPFELVTPENMADYMN